MSNDRTNEFMALARGMPRTTTTTTSAVSSPPPPTTTSTATQSSVQELKSFHKTAATLSKDIAATSAMLGELTRLVQHKSLFMDDSTQINSLVFQIKQNVENLNQRLELADQQLKHNKHKLGTQANQEGSNLLGQLQEEFCQATSGFKQVLQERTDSIKTTEQLKHDVYYDSRSAPTSASASIPLLNLENKPPVYEDSKLAAGSTAFPTLDLTSGYNMSPGEPTSSLSLPRPHGARGNGGGSSSYMTTTTTPNMSRSESLPTYSGGTSTYHHSQQQQPLTPLDMARLDNSQEQQQMQLIPDQDYLRERANAMETVETNIVELGKVFNKLAVMVHEHHDMVRRVEDNVDDANQNILLSMETLGDTLASLRTNKALALKVFGVLVLFIILFITFFA